jgi:antirestriction protein ArdC
LHAGSHQLPPREAFIGTATSSPAEAYYSTLLHELTHWTSAPARCNRELGKRFGDKAYAMEELVAELGAAFLCAELGITDEPRADHAQYLDHWLTVMKADKKAIFTAASKASEAAAFLAALQGA